MPETAYLLAAFAALVAAALAVVAVRHRATRSSRTRASRSVEAPAAPAGETESTLAGTRSELAAARSEVARLTEQLRQATARTDQAPARTDTAREPAAPTGDRHLEIFVNLSRRLQSLVHREIQLLDGLENEVEDPDLLKGLFQVDHLATRIRRHAENLAVLGGSVSRRQWSRPVPLTEVLRSAIAEVEHYSRVKLVPPIEGTLPGHAVASVIHLIAELIENATMFAPPHTQVLLRVQQVTSGVAVEVEDRGLGMQRADLDRVNRLLADSESTDLDELLRDGRIGLYVVSVIARQHGIVVQLQPNIYGGIQAVIILPRLLVGSVAEAAPEPSRPRSLTVSPEPRSFPERLPLQKRVPSHHRFTVSEPPLPVAEDTTEIVPQAVRPIVQPVLLAPAPVPSPRPAPTTTPARAPSRQIAAAPGTEPAPAHTPARPPLPRRRSQTHMAPQLQLGPPRAATEPAPEHDPGLMASFMNGISQGEAGTGRHG
ncbi:sensor histidine kinase KdpD [Actinoplanes sp. DH11]|uniref:sensor histidine kinase n=1 Tax=Actinoplanes sp. DH11 TaxID=2857011 RepID=UPI001E5C80B0|nr:ATP-binding protein [Actinoplanes sp. DH11]